MSEWKNREIILKRRTGKSSLKFAESILLIENKKKQNRCSTRPVLEKEAWRHIQTYPFLLVKSLRIKASQRNNHFKRCHAFYRHASYFHV